MTSMPTEQLTTRGYEPPRNTQFSIFLDNRVGKLMELIDIFDGQAISVVAFNILDSTDHAVIRLLTSRSDLARRLLVRNHMTFSETDVLVVEFSSRRTLSQLCSSLLSAELNICFAYPLMVRPRGDPAIALRTDDQELAGQILRRKLFTLLGENDLGDNATPGDQEGSGNIPA